jgi:hypothetical protein
MGWPGVGCVGLRCPEPVLTDVGLAESKNKNKVEEIVTELFI